MGILDGKVAVITGSTRGLGLGVAKVFLSEGASVVISGRTEQAVADAVQSLQQEAGTRVTGLPTDVTDLERVKSLARHAIEQYGRIDVWVNNAGLPGMYGPTTEVDPHDFEQVTKTTIFGQYYGSLVALHSFQQQESGGKLINLLGQGDKKPVANQNAYAASRMWVRSFTSALAKENVGSKNIGIFAINPGLVNTDLIRKIDAVQGREQRLKAFSVIIRLWANPPEVPAQKLAWLASAATDGKTGLEIQFLNTQRKLAGAGKELKRLLLRQPAPDTSLTITNHEPYRLH